jgi:hypothetical protein
MIYGKAGLNGITVAAGIAEGHSMVYKEVNAG